MFLGDLDIFFFFYIYVYVFWKVENRFSVIVFIMRLFW